MTEVQKDENVVKEEKEYVNIMKYNDDKMSDANMNDERNAVARLFMTEAESILTYGFPSTAADELLQEGVSAASTAAKTLAAKGDLTRAQSHHEIRKLQGKYVTGGGDVIRFTRSECSFFLTNVM